MEGLQIQAAAAILLPAIVQFVKKMAPFMEGKKLLYANLALNMAVAVGVLFSVDGITAGLAATTLVGGGILGLGGSKMIDLGKHGTTLSERHRGQ